MYDECLACRQLLNVFTSEVKGCLQYSTLAGHGYHLVVLMPEGRTDAPRVAHGKHLAAARHAAHHIAAVVVRHRGTQHIGHLHVVFYIMSNVCAFQSFLLSLDEQAFYFPVQSMPHQFERDIRVAVDAGGLPLLYNLLEYLFDVRHVEVAAKTEVLCPPVVATQEGMHILKTALASSGVTQVTHE